MSYSLNFQNDRELTNDVQISDFIMSWETHNKITSIIKGYVR
jgi:hypothetical protein